MLMVACCALAGIYIFQRFNFIGFFVSIVGFDPQQLHPYVVFIGNRVIRLTGNDLSCMVLIYVFFRERKYLVVAWYFYLFELLVVMPVYFLIKLQTEGVSEISSPLLSQIHRLIVNPVLMILLMLAFLYQKIKRR